MTDAAHPYLSFGLGNDGAARIALLGAGLLLGLGFVPGVARAIERIPSRIRLVSLAAAAAALSWGYLVHYLRSGPRVVDATHYFLEARALSHGLFAFPVPGPLASFNGRFLLTDPTGQLLAVLFPPGYPAVLAFAFWLGEPMALGPVIAGALVFATYAGARAFGATQTVSAAAAALGVLSAALRYHTADTMSHGWSALLLIVALTGAARGSLPAILLSGSCSGWLLASRPASGVVALLAVCWLLRKRGKAVLWLVLACLPGVLLLLGHQHAVTGHFSESTQRAYYAVADGPPGCFRYGFGAGIGCWFEHGDFVRANLPHGYGLREALANTGRRLMVHSMDIANAAPLVLAVPLAPLLARRPGPRALLAVTCGILVAYAPFYFDGSYPGGGARLFAEALPLEHILVAETLAALRVLRFAWPLSLAAFALHTHQQHWALAEREGGRPMFEPEVLAAHHVKSGLVFVSTDHGFALGHDPGGDAASGPIVARLRGDSLDRLLWEHLGRPPAYRYLYAAQNPGARPMLEPFIPTVIEPRRIEAESLWPPLRVGPGWTQPAYTAHPCTSQGRGLRLHSDGKSSAELSLVLPGEMRQLLVLGWVERQAREVWVRWSADQPWLLVPWEPSFGPCERSQAIGPPTGLAMGPAIGPERVPRALRIELRGQGGVMDYLELGARESKTR